MSMRKFLNTWLRQWAEASLRHELYGAQEKLFRTQRARDNLLNDLAERKELMQRLVEKHKSERSFDSALIGALKARMPSDLFDSVVSHCKNKVQK